MTDYRLYCLNDEGQIGFAEWIKAVSDEEAIKEARRMKPDAIKCEIWDRGRLVAKLDHQQPV